MPRIFYPLLATMLLGICVFPVQAALLNTSVTGSLEFEGSSSNFFDPIYNFVPDGYLNSVGTTVTISNTAVEFGYNDSANLINANFTDNQLVISDLVEANGFNYPFTLQFTNAAFSGLTITTVSDNFPLQYSLNNDVLTMNWSGGSVIGQTFVGTYDLLSTPEPSSAGILLFSGLAIVAFARLRRTASS